MERQKAAQVAAELQLLRSMDEAQRRVAAAVCQVGAHARAWTAGLQPALVKWMPGPPLPPQPLRSLVTHSFRIRLPAAPFPAPASACSYRRLLAQVREEMLYLRCPCCRTVFELFDGCFAVKCGSCPAKFCGWCTRDCSADGNAHAHVYRCPSNRVGASNASLQLGMGMSDAGKREALQAAHKPRRVQRVRDFLRGMQSQADAAAVAAQLRRDLAGLGISLEEVGYAAAAAGGAAGAMPGVGAAGAEPPALAGGGDGGGDAAQAARLRAHEHNSSSAPSDLAAAFDFD
jgi:hypothetical protein